MTMTLEAPAPERVETADPIGSADVPLGPPEWHSGDGSGDAHVVFRNAPPELYDAFSLAYTDRPGVRLNYDGSTLEIMSISAEHDAYKSVLGDMVSLAARAMRRDTARRGSTTLKFKRDVAVRGLEADESFWIQHHDAVFREKQIDLSIHPPPDLVVEVDLSSHAVDREALYLQLGVPELWRFDRKTGLTGWRSAGGAWEPIERSIAFPELRLADLDAFARRIMVDRENAILDDFAAHLAALPR